MLQSSLRSIVVPLCGLWLLSSAAEGSAIYRYQDAAGAWHYSDQRPLHPGAREISRELQPLSTFRNVTLPEIKLHSRPRPRRPAATRASPCARYRRQVRRIDS